MLSKRYCLNYETNMLTYCLKCKKNTKNIDAKMMKTKNDRFMLSLKCSICGSKKSKFTKEQEADGLLSNLGIKAPLILSYKMNGMNKVVDRFLKIGDKFMPEMHLRQPGFIYSACGPFTKNKQRIQKFIETGDTKYIYRNKLDKACFQPDMAYGDFKDLKKEEHNQVKS